TSRFVRCKATITAGPDGCFPTRYGPKSGGASLGREVYGRGKGSWPSRGLGFFHPAFVPMTPVRETVAGVVLRVDWTVGYKRVEGLGGARGATSCFGRPPGGDERW